MPKGKRFSASATGTYHRNIRFVSAQRGKKTRSAASRYRRYVRLTSTTGELRLQLIKCQSKKEKERHAKRVIRAVGRSASTHTASPPLPSLSLGFGHRAVFVPAMALTYVRKLSAVTPNAVTAQAR